jgi:hypothetical protein
MAEHESEADKRRRLIVERFTEIASGAYSLAHSPPDSRLSEGKSVEFAQKMAAAIELLDAQLSEAGLLTQYFRITDCLIRLPHDELMVLMKRFLFETLDVFLDARQIANLVKR